LVVIEKSRWSVMTFLRTVIPLDLSV